MKRSTFSEEQLVYAIRQAKAGTPVDDLCRQLGVSDATFYALQPAFTCSLQFSQYVCDRIQQAVP